MFPNSLSQNYRINTAFLPIALKGTSFFLVSNGAFGVQHAVQGAMGVVSSRHYCRRCFFDSNATQIPIYLAEISPPALRATFPGVAYQMGNVSLLNAT